MLTNTLLKLYTLYIIMSFHSSKYLSINDIIIHDNKNGNYIINELNKRIKIKYSLQRYQYSSKL